jgi:hypothetical protein
VDAPGASSPNTIQSATTLERIMARSNSEKTPTAEAEQHATGRCARIVCLLMQIQIDPARLHVGQEGNEVLERPAQAVHDSQAAIISYSLRATPLRRASNPGR